MLSWDLGDWITDAGADVLDKRLADPMGLTPAESVVYEIWLLDTEARNGGLPYSAIPTRLTGLRSMEKPSSPMPLSSAGCWYRGQW